MTWDSSFMNLILTVHLMNVESFLEKTPPILITWLSLNARMTICQFEHKVKTLTFNGYQAWFPNHCLSGSSSQFHFEVKIQNEILSLATVSNGRLCKLAGRCIWVTFHRSLKGSASANADIWSEGNLTESSRVQRLEVVTYRKASMARDIWHFRRQIE